MESHVMSRIQVVLVILLMLLAGPAAAVERTLYTVAPPGFAVSAFLNIVNPLTGATITSVPISLSGAIILGANGLARDPTTEKLYAVLNLLGQQRRLVTIDPATGNATSIGTMTSSFAALAFKSDGTLYGVTGDGANVPESLFVINKTNASASLVAALGNGNDGEAIAFNPSDGLFYHASGNDTLGAPPLAEIFESVNPATPDTPSNIPLSGAYTPLTSNYLEVASLTHLAGNLLLLADGDSAASSPGPRLYTITTTGVVTLLGAMDHTAKGMAFAPKQTADFDRDLKADVGIYRDGVWSILRSSDGGNTVVGLGGPTWTPVPADYDGDGKADIAAYLNGTWVILRSSDNQTVVAGAGGPTFVPVPGDYDGDGKADVAVYSDGVWSIIRSSDGGNTVIAHGGPGWTAAPADYDGDGKTDVAVYLNGAWSIKRSSDNGITVVGHGGPAWIPVAADYDGDGKADVAAYTGGAWSIIRSSDAGNTVVGHGGPAWTPLTADYDGDGKTDITVYLNGAWSIKRSSDNTIQVVGHGGGPTDIPLN